MASLARKPGKQNWIENLPKPLQEAFEKSWLHRVAEHLAEPRGDMTVGHAIAVGVNAAKKACATGDLNWPGVQHINLASKSQACAAVAVWESMKAAAHRPKVSKGRKVTEADVEAVFKGLSQATGKIEDLMAQDA